MFKKLKDAVSVRLKLWLCGRMPLPELVIEHRKFDLIDINSTVDLMRFQGVPNEKIEEMAIMQMFPEIKKYVGFIDVEMHDGNKYKQAILKVATKAT